MTTADDRFEAAHATLGELHATLAATVLGQAAVIDTLLAAVIGGGHILLEGLPGLGKTRLANALATALGLHLARVQCTPDLLPADVTGGEVPGADGRLEWRPGPLFAPLVLVDEINRAPPRTQAAFLEAMQERQVTHLGQRYPLPSPFTVIATQNPIELEGTWPLPEAQLDRFAVKIEVPYPARETLLDLASAGPPPLPGAVVTMTALDAAVATVDEIVVTDTLRAKVVDTLLCLQPGGGEPAVDAQVRYGPSPRALASWLRCARALALLKGRAHVAMTDLHDVALPVLRHRVLLRFEAEVEGVTTDSLLTGVLARTFV